MVPFITSDFMDVWQSKIGWADVSFHLFCVGVANGGGVVQDRILDTTSAMGDIPSYIYVIIVIIL